MDDLFEEPTIPATVFQRPNARQTDIKSRTDETTAAKAMAVLDAVENSRFTLEDCGAFYCVCLEGDVNGERDDLVIRTYGPEYKAMPWAEFIADCKKTLGIR